MGGKMGVDVYLSWTGITEEEKQKQFVGYDCTCGRFGYLRSSYCGVAYEAISQFFGKYYDIGMGKPIKFDFKYIENNLKEMEKGIFKKRAKEFYKKGKVSEIQSYRDFLALAKQKKKEGKKVMVTIR